jgi:hypothetical protein
MFASQSEANSHLGFGPILGQKSLYICLSPTNAPLVFWPPQVGKDFLYLSLKVRQILIWFLALFSGKSFYLIASHRQILLLFFGQWAKISTVYFQEQEVRQLAYNFSTLEGAKG